MDKRDINVHMQIYNYVSLFIAGMLGTFVRQLYVKRVSIFQRISEYIAGALCAIYGAQIVASIICSMLCESGFVLVRDKLLSFSAFLCGMFGLSLCEYGFQYITYLKKKKY